MESPYMHAFKGFVLDFQVKFDFDLQDFAIHPVI